MQNQTVLEQQLILDARSKLSMTGVDAVDGFSDSYLNLTVLGGKVQIAGENIKITSYNSIKKTCK